MNSASWGKPKHQLSMIWDWRLRGETFFSHSLHPQKKISTPESMLIKIDKWLRWLTFLIYAFRVFFTINTPPPPFNGKTPFQSPSFRWPSPNLRLVRSKEPPPKAVNEILVAPHFGIFVATPMLPRPAVETAMLSQRFLLFWPETRGRFVFCFIFGM